MLTTVKKLTTLTGCSKAVANGFLNMSLRGGLATVETPDTKEKTGPGRRETVYRLNDGIDWEGFIQAAADFAITEREEKRATLKAEAEAAAKRAEAAAAAVADARRLAEQRADELAKEANERAVALAALESGDDIDIDDEF